MSTAGRGDRGSRDLPHVTPSPTSPPAPQPGTGEQGEGRWGAGMLLQSGMETRARIGVSEGELLCFYLQDAQKAVQHLLSSPFLYPFTPGWFKAPSS